MATQDERRTALDAYMSDGGELNNYGDPAPTMYTGGSPLFNESTGESTSKEDYHMERYGRSLEETEKMAADIASNAT